MEFSWLSRGGERERKERNKIRERKKERVGEACSKTATWQREWEMERFDYGLIWV